ncbi:cytochrome b5, partial [Colletotrichum incanum]
MSTIRLTYKQLAERNANGELYLTIHRKIYNCSTFFTEHPGGKDVLLNLKDRDATKAFESVGHSSDAQRILNQLFVGFIQPE